MNAENAVKELELAAYEMAEAERCERKAKNLREHSIRRVASVHAEIIVAMKLNSLKTKSNL